MTNVRIAFEVLESNEAIPVGLTKVPLRMKRMIFDLKLDLTGKARLVARGI